MVNVRISEMSWVDVQKALDRGFRTVVFGVGSSERHGPHLPTCTDSLIGDDLANRVARKLGNALARAISVTSSAE
jgi:creatinine amidohydrolase